MFRIFEMFRIFKTARPNLLERAQAGDREALERIVSRQLRLLRRYVKQHFSTEALALLDVDEIIRDTIINTIGRIPSNLFVHAAAADGLMNALARTDLLDRIRNELRRLRPDAPHLADDILLARYERAFKALGPKGHEIRERAEREAARLMNAALRRTERDRDDDSSGPQR